MLMALWRDRERVDGRGPPLFFRPPTPYPRRAVPSDSASTAVAPSVPVSMLPAPVGRPANAECFMPMLGDASRSRRFAYALLDPPSASPGFVLRRAFEAHGGNPAIGLAASHYGALMVVFHSAEDREASMALFLLSFVGHRISLEWPELAENRVGWRNSCFAQIFAFGFPLEHWTEGGIRTAFRPIGSVCCIDPLCLNDLDFSVVRLVLHLENDGVVPLSLLLRDFEGETTTVVELEVICTWSAFGDFSHAGRFVGGCGNTPHRGGAPRCSPPPPRRGGLDDIDSASLDSANSDLASPPAAAVGASPTALDSPALSLWSRVVAGRANMLGTVGAPTSAASAVVAWDHILSHGLAAEFPEEGLAAEECYDSLATTVVPPSDIDGALLADPAPPSLPPAQLNVAFSVVGDVHEDAARKHEVRRKREWDSAFKARRSARLASKEPALFTDMLTRAKEVKASHFNPSKGSPHLRAAMARLCIDDGVPEPIPLPVLQELGVPCGVDPTALS
ncbi:unnamed protein product [Alopecurus aequalis]